MTRFDDADEATHDIILDNINQILTSIDNDEPYSPINRTDFLFKMLGDDFIKNHNLLPLHKRIKNFLLNPTNNRMLRMNQRIKLEIETAVEYLDKDIGNDTRLFYKTELEKEILNIHDDIRTALAIIVQNQIGQNTIDKMIK
jgi:hypothetical protein